VPWRRDIAQRRLSRGNEVLSTVDDTPMIRFVKIVGYAWLLATAMCILGIVAVLWLTDGWKAVTDLMVPEYLLIVAAAFLPGLLLLFLERKEERVEEQEEEDENRSRP
jgi:hypothetical protein